MEVQGEIYMGRVIGIVSIFLMFTGISIAGWNVYQWWQSQQSVHQLQTIEVPEITVETEHKQKTELKTNSNFSTLQMNESTGDQVAELIIPELGLSYDVYWGTDENTLTEGVGMYVSEWTSVPNHLGGHTVLSGHRDTVFTGLGDLETGDLLHVKYKGELFQYQINKTWITDPDDRTVIIEKEESTLTLTTCYPFQYFGPAPERYIVQAEQI